MDRLASFFVSFVALANVIIPGANLPRTLGVYEAYDVADNQPQVMGETTSSVSAQVKERLQEVASKREERRVQFRHKLQEIKDTKKRQVLENLDTRLTAVKDKWVENWTNTLDRLNSIVLKLEEKNVSSASSAIIAAKSAINTAQDKVTEIAGKDYVFTINDEQSLGQDARDFISAFKEDMQAVHASVKAAREAVRTAFDATRQGASDGQ